ncbi:hypothetical protein MKW94_023615 [Papaver nudicaule]|uniref:Mitochondrial glycoprotein n=1 Tax=Papaver nudicaule TaxID=74823 RepID=A0AA41VUC3_PAPNU|nr:hypothetical protein [Papaver nudicaule]
MATLSRMMKKAASSLIPLANRSLHPRNYTSAAIFTTPLKNTTINSTSNLVSRAASIPTHRHFSALAKKKPDSDDDLVNIIEEEINCAKKESVKHEAAKAPRDFAFEIEDKPGNETITLTRKYKGEEIKVTVHMSEDLGDFEEDEEEEKEGEAEKDKDEEEEDDEEESDPRYVELVVNVSKKSEPTLEFSVTAEADGITINSLAVKYPNASDEDIPYAGPEFEDLDENLKEAFYDYLEVRGIQPSIAQFLYEYMAGKELKEYTGWLKTVKNFVAK